MLDVVQQITTVVIGKRVDTAQWSIRIRQQIGLIQHGGRLEPFERLPVIESVCRTLEIGVSNTEHLIHFSQGPLHGDAGVEMTAQPHQDALSIPITITGEGHHAGDA